MAPGCAWERPKSKPVSFFFSHVFSAGSRCWTLSAVSAGDKMSVVQANLPRRRKREVAKSTGCLLKRGSEVRVACGRGIRYVGLGGHPRCCGRMCPCKGGEGGMSKECGLADERFFAPTASCFSSNNDEVAATWLDKFWARPFFGPLRIPYCRACVLSSGAAWLVKGETMVASMANWFLPRKGKYIGYDFDLSVVDTEDGGDVEIWRKGVSGDSGSIFSANVGSCSLQRRASASKCPWQEAAGSLLWRSGLQRGANKLKNNVLSHRPGTSVWSTVNSTVRSRQNKCCAPMLADPERKMYPKYPTSMLHKSESSRSMYCKIEWKKFALLNWKVPIHSCIRPLPQPLVPAVQLKFRLPMKMWAPNSVCSIWAPTQNSSNSTCLR